jgi:hypothetical protein
MKNLNIIFISLILIFAYCNPSSVDSPKKTWSGLHSVPLGPNGIFHGSHYRYPIGYCDEANCHGPSLTGGNTGGFSCYRCHDNLWDIFQTHTVERDGYYHHRNLCLSPHTTYCGTSYCHGDTLNGGSGPACSKCHSSTKYCD